MYTMVNLSSKIIEVYYSETIFYELSVVEYNYKLHTCTLENKKKTSLDFEEPRGCNKATDCDWKRKDMHGLCHVSQFYCS